MLLSDSYSAVELKRDAFHVEYLRRYVVLELAALGRSNAEIAKTYPAPSLRSASTWSMSSIGPGL
jgi:hypothetical protein